MLTKSDLVSMLESLTMPSSDEMLHYVEMNDQGKVLGRISTPNPIDTTEFPKMIQIPEPDETLMGAFYDYESSEPNVLDRFIRQELPPPIMSFEQAQALMMAKTSLGLVLDFDQEIQAQESVILVAQVLPIPDGQEWKPGLHLASGTIVTRNGANWQVVQSHVSEANWPPETTPALFTEIRDDFAPWVQPLGAHDAYMRGDKVTHNGAKWVSDIDSNVWPPGVHGWTQINH